jgi:hypothetical protein
VNSSSISSYHPEEELKQQKENGKLSMIRNRKKFLILNALDSFSISDELEII